MIPMYNVTIAPDKYDAAILPTFDLLEELADWFRRAARNGDPGSTVRLREAGFAERCLEVLQRLQVFSEAATVEPRVRAAAEQTADFTGPVPVEVLARSLPPIQGGSPVAYEPTPADWACLEYETWLDSLPPDDRLFHERLWETMEREPADRDIDEFDSDGLPPLW